MSDFNVPLVTIEKISEHPDPETTSLELVHVFGYQCVVKKGNFKVGDQVFYIPEQALVTPKIIEDLNLEGFLSGPDKNRVKAIKLRKVLSQGILYPITFTDIKPSVDVDHDYAEELGITKYEPRIPENMSGRIRPAGPWAKYLFRFDFNDIKRERRNSFREGEPVIITEKLHGTFVQFVYVIEEDTLLISSKGLSKQGIIIEDTPENANNVYVKMAKNLNILEKLRTITAERPDHMASIQALGIMGEIVGPGIQDMTYGLTKPEFFMFGCFIYNGNSVDISETTNITVPENFEDTIIELDASYMYALHRMLDVDLVPLINYGFWSSEEDLREMEDVMSDVSVLNPGGLREGVVICSQSRYGHNGMLARAKMITPKYLLRKNGTEYN